MDSFLLDQQRQLKKYRINFIKGVVGAFLFALVLALVTAFIPWFSWLSEREQNIPDQWITAEIVFEEIKYVEGRKLGGNYYLFDQNGNEYQSLVTEEKNELLQKQLIKDHVYTIMFSYARSGEVKRICFLKDSNQIYINLKEGTEKFYKNKLIALRIILFYICFVPCVFIAIYIRKSNDIKKNLKRMHLCKKRINYYKLNNDILSEEASLELAYENLLQETEKTRKSIEFSATTAEIMLYKYSERAEEKYKSTKLYKRSLIVMLLGSFVLYICLTGFLIANFQAETDWQNKKIVFNKIIVDDYLPGLYYISLYDQSGNSYKLPPTVEYKYLDLKEQLIVGEPYEIVCGTNRFIFRNQDYLYQLTADSEIYIAQEEAAEVFMNYGTHWLLLVLLCPVIILIFFVATRSLKKEMNVDKEVMNYFTGLFSFYKHTGLLLPEMYSDEEEDRH